MNTGRPRGRPPKYPKGIPLPPPPPNQGAHNQGEPKDPELGVEELFGGPEEQPKAKVKAKLSDEALVAERKSLSHSIMAELKKENVDTRAYARLAAQDIQLARQLYEAVDEKAVKAASGAHQATLSILNAAGFEKKASGQDEIDRAWAEMVDEL